MWFNETAALSGEQRNFSVSEFHAMYGIFNTLIPYYYHLKDPAQRAQKGTYCLENILQSIFSHI